jgi:flagellar biogenesis protein FliO
MKRSFLTMLMALALSQAAFCLNPAATPVCDEYGYQGMNVLTGAYAIRIVLVLAVMAGLAYAAVKLMKKFKIAPGAFNSVINVIAIKTITGDKKAAIIEARGREYLVGISKDSMVVIDKLETTDGKRKK